MTIKTQNVIFAFEYQKLKRETAVCEWPWFGSDESNLCEQYKLVLVRFRQIHHYCAIKMNVTGDGNIKDEIKE